jgi:hypothetical protein
MKRILGFALLWIVIAPGAWAAWNSGRFGEATFGGHTYIDTTQPAWLDEWDRQGFEHRETTSTSETEANLIAGSWSISDASWVHQPFDKALIQADVNVSNVNWATATLTLTPYIQGYYDAEPYLLDADKWSISITGTGHNQRVLYWDVPDGEPYFWASESVVGATVSRVIVYVRPTED